MSFFGLFRRRSPVSVSAPLPKRAAAIAAAVALSVSVIAHFEGYVGHVYRDPVGVPTYCYGETTNVRYRSYSREECAVLLQARAAKDYAPKVLDCVPSLIDTPHVFAASIDAAYNAGTQAFCRSRMAKSFNLHRWAEGCNGFVGWYETAKGKKLAGLVRRRAAEKALCAKDL